MSALDPPEAVLLFETAPDVWEDISADLRGGSVTRGRQRELDRYQTGRATLSLANADRKYDPTHTAGPFAGKLKPSRRMQVLAAWNDLTFPIFFGYIDGIASQANGPNDNTATFTLSDAFKVLNRARMVGRSFISMLPGERITELLDLIDFPLALRDIDDGATTLQAGTYEETFLEHAQKVAQTEFGDLFVMADGTVRFRSRDAGLNLPVMATFGDGPGEIGYRSLTPQYDDTLIRNPVTVDRDGGIAQTVEDAALKAPPPAGYGINHFKMDKLLHESDELSHDIAGYILLRYKEPDRRIVGMELGPPSAAEAELLYPQMLGRELAERVLVRERPQGVGDAISQESAIEGIAHTFSPGIWTTKWNLSPSFAAGSFWQIGIAGHSEIGVTTRVYF